MGAAGESSFWAVADSRALNEEQVGERASFIGARLPEVSLLDVFNLEPSNEISFDDGDA